MRAGSFKSIGIAVCVAVFATSLAYTEVQLRFAAEVRYPAGSDPNSVAVGDFNSDGRQDLAVGNRMWPSEDISVLLGNGDGSFAPQIRYPAGNGASFVAIGDFDADGQQDLAVANAGSSDVSVLRGNGDGSFAPQTRYPAGGGPSSVAIGDFDDDGRQDLAVVNFWNYYPDGNEHGDVSVLLGIGDGSFAPETRYSAGEGPFSVAIGDFDGDRRQDLVVANVFSTDVSVLLGNGDGSFAPQTRYPAGSDPVSIAIGDFNADGRQDLAVANWASHDISVLFGNGDGSFATQTRYSAGVGPHSVAIGDFDGDRRQDLVVANVFSTDVSVLRGNGDGSFAPQTRHPAGGGPSSVAIGDFDDDGRQDLAVANQGSDDISVLLNRSYVPVEIGIESNSVNPYNRGVIPVVIFGVEDLDVSDIDVTTLRFGPNDTPPKHDLTDPFDYNEHLEDMNLDGYMDLMLHFETQDAGIACGNTEAMLFGQTLSGQFFEGFDTYETVGCNSNRPPRGRTSRNFERMQREQPPANTEEQQHPGDLVEEQRVD